MRRGTDPGHGAGIPGSATVTQVLPEKKTLQLEGLYLGQRLLEMSIKIGRSLVIADFLTDRNGVIAQADEQHDFRVPPELRNSSDWRLFQELLVQADVIIIGKAYLKRVSALGSRAENILSQFEAGGGFDSLGKWRLEAGYQNSSPDLAIVSRSLDLDFPEAALRGDRRRVVFTTLGMADSDKAKALRTSGTLVIGSGEAGVDGNQVIDTLSNRMGYRVIMMATGPSVLELLLQAKRLDLLYVTEAQLEIPFDDPATVQTILPGGKKVSDLQDFQLAHQYLQENVATQDGSLISQLFLRYDRKSVLTR